MRGLIGAAMAEYLSEPDDEPKTDPIEYDMQADPSVRPWWQRRRAVGLAAGVLALAVAAGVGVEMHVSGGPHPGEHGSPSVSATALAHGVLPSHEATGSGGPTPAASETGSPAERQFVQQAGASLLALHNDSHGGWRFRSGIQGPNYQTDRDVGAAGVGVAFLALAQLYPQDGRWLEGAKKTASWLMAVVVPDNAGGLSWPDYANDGDVAREHYTSFDDGALGVGDFFWRLYEQTHDEQYKKVAMQSVEWTLRQAENIGTADQPAYRWPYDASDRSSERYMGMGQGLVGTIDTLTLYYDRTKNTDPTFAALCRRYAEGGLRALAKARAALGANDGDSRALPETGIIGQDGDTAENSGYLSGAAGAAFMYLHAWRVFGNGAYRTEAERLLAWLNDTTHGPKIISGGGATWQVALDPRDKRNPENKHYATGVEEGNAGIGWEFLQAFRDTGNTTYLATAQQAADWLLRIAVPAKGGLSWREYMNPPSSEIHANMNNGAAGIAVFLYDLGQVLRVRGDPDAAKYLAAAQAARQWLTASVAPRGNVIYWPGTDDGEPYKEAVDPSVHWGIGGVVLSLGRISGGKLDTAGGMQTVPPFGSQ
jgi:hypothetical protein